MRSSRLTLCQPKAPAERMELPSSTWLCPPTIINYGTPKLDVAVPSDYHQLGAALIRVRGYLEVRATATRQVVKRDGRCRRYVEAVDSSRASCEHGNLHSVICDGQNVPTYATTLVP